MYSPSTLRLCFFLTLLATALSHAIMTIPNQRGTLRGKDPDPKAPSIDPESEQDYSAHFPAGDKRGSPPGAGGASQIRAAGPKGWTPFEPLNPNFRWRAGVCGDDFGKPEHMRGGKYYNDGQIVATYKQGGKISISISMIGHHNGFMEFHLCNVKKCDNGEISQKCFRDGHCVQLQRSRNPVCDSGLSKGCAPIDPNYPGRWYLPCSRCGLEECWNMYGGDLNTIVYDLPPHMSCEHCVLQWYWSTANSCNPPGLVDFFDSDNAPKAWGNCVGFSNAVGGFARDLWPCGLGEDGQKRYAEEYLQCADIAITPNGQTPSVPSVDNRDGLIEEDNSPGAEEYAGEGDGSSDSTDSESAVPEPEPVSAEEVETGDRDGDIPSGSGVFSKFVLHADGMVVGTIKNGDSFDVSGYRGFTIEAVTSKPVSAVLFYINGENVKTEYHAPYILSGNSGDTLHYWSSPILNKEFTLVAMADGNVYEVSMTFTK